MWYHLFISCVLSMLGITSLAVEMRKISVITVTGLKGESAVLPCDVSHPADDTIYLILWFRDTLTTPIYRFDDRSSLSRGKQSHWKDEEQIGSRAHLEVSSSKSILKLSSLTLSDQGFYKCRVDFKKQPTKTTRVDLNVVVPPKTVSVTVESSGSTTTRPVTRVVGPYLEGDILSLTCFAHGGIPRATITWHEKDSILDGDMESEEPESIVEDPEQILNTTLNPWPSETTPNHPSPAMSIDNRIHEEDWDPFNILKLGPLTRSDLKRSFTCKASNNNITNPLSSVVMLDINLPPLSVTIRTPEKPLTAGKEYQIKCEVLGARPPPLISWFKNDTLLSRAMHSQTPGDGEMTTSILKLKPTSFDDGISLKCVAESRHTNTSMEKVVTLSVYYVPTASVAFGSSLDAANIKEGDDVYFECIIRANPRVSHVSWKHNNESLEHGVADRIIVSNQSLVLQKVVRYQAGKYTCHAHNTIGDCDSDSLWLDVKFAPVCSEGQVTMYAVERYEDAEVLCKVEANPLEASFQWTFNNTADTIDVPQGRYTSTSSHSIITYTPMTSLDYGTLLCWASNEIGSQQEPCLYHIVPAGKPDRPENCTISMKTRVSVKINCVSGNSGGLKQTYFLQAILHNSQHTVNVTSKTPVFKIDRLKPKQKYDVYITAHNDKGSSSPTHLVISSIGTNSLVYQLHDGPSEAEVRDGGTTSGVGFPFDFGSHIFDDMPMAKLIPGALGIAAGLILVIIILILLIIFRTRRSRNQDSSCASLTGEEQLGFIGSKSPSMTPKQTTSCSERELQVESESDAEPDVIPLQEGFRVAEFESFSVATLLPHDCYQYPKVSSTSIMHSLGNPSQTQLDAPSNQAAVPLSEEGYTEPYIIPSYSPPLTVNSHHHHHQNPVTHHHRQELPHSHHPSNSDTKNFPLHQLPDHPPLVHHTISHNLQRSSTLPRNLSGQKPFIQHHSQHSYPIHQSHSNHPHPGPQSLSQKATGPHGQLFPDVKGSLPLPPVEYQTEETKRAAFKREAPHFRASKDDSPTTPLLSKRESSV